MYRSENPATVLLHHPSGPVKVKFRAAHPSSMAAALQSRCLQMRFLMRGVQKQAVLIQNAHLSHASLHIFLPELAQMHPAMLKATFESSLPRVSSAHFQLMRSEHELFTNEFVQLLNTLLPLLSRLGSAIVPVAGSGSVEETIFWNLWTFLMLSCVMHTRPDFWGPGHERPFCPQLYDALHSLLTWLLQLTRTPAWTAMQAQHGLLCRNHELQLMLLCPMQCLNNMSQAPGSELLSHLNSIPANLTPLLCCIISEQFGTLPSLCSTISVQPGCHSSDVQMQASAGRAVRAYSHQLSCTYNPPPCGYKLCHSLVRLVTRFTEQESNMGDGIKVFAFLRSPSVIHTLRVILLLPRQARPTIPTLVEDTLYAIKAVYCSGASAESSSSSDSLSDKDAEENQDPRTGLPRHLNPLRSTRVLATDIRVLHAVNTVDSGFAAGEEQREDDEELMLLCYSAQIDMVKSWLDAGTACRAPADALKVMAESMVGIAKQCTVAALVLTRRMPGAALCLGRLLAGEQQRLQDKQQPSQHQGQQQQQGMPQPNKQQEHQKREQVHEQRTKRAEARLTLLGEEGMECIRSLLYLTEAFRIVYQRQDQRVLSPAGK